MVEIIEKYFPKLSQLQKKQFQILGGLYKEWNEKINVISRKDIDNIYIHHILHSLAIAKIVEFVPDTKILDVGTGGGFPGIPLAILFPQVSFILIDSIAKKIKVVEEIVKALDLENVSAFKKPAQEETGKYDFIISRAVTRMNNFLPWVENNISNQHKNTLKNGFIFLKGGNLTEEIAELRTKATIFKITDYFDEDYFQTKRIVYLNFPFRGILSRPFASGLRGLDH